MRTPAVPVSDRFINPAPGLEEAGRLADSQGPALKLPVVALNRAFVLRPTIPGDPILDVRVASGLLKSVPRNIRGRAQPQRAKASRGLVARGGRRQR
jgi:hypothetical protein